MPKSQTKRRYQATVQQERKLWASLWDRCMGCGSRSSWPSFEVHEIERRAQAPRTWGHVCNYLYLCQDCHSTTFASLPHVLQLAVKLVRDPNNYDLAAWLKIADAEGRAPNRIMQWEVEACARLLRYDASARSIA